MTLRFTRRQRGFKVTPTDFLILFIALGVPYITGTYVKDTDLALMVDRIIVLFFSYEVLIGELRGEVNKLAIATGASLALVVIRGLV
jgi:UDP-GlcNAc:undecaprenyl-phosphate GlcNAc-1-phosphate transferase